jgi:hypothetical protein
LRVYSSLIKHLLVVLSLSIAASCSPLLKMHHETNPMNIAVLNIEDTSLSEVEYIDGGNVQSIPSKRIFEILPGRHVVQVYYKNHGSNDGPDDVPKKADGSSYRTNPVLVKFNALPRHLYSLICHTGSYYSGAEIVDVTDEAIEAVKAKKNMGKWNWTKGYLDKWQLTH